MLEHRRTARKDDVLLANAFNTRKKGAGGRTYLIQPPPNVDRRLLNDSINDIREGSQEIGRVYLRVKEDLGCEESFVSDVDAV